MFLKETGRTAERVLRTEHTTGSALRNEPGLRHLQGADETDLFVILWDPLGTPCSASEWPSSLNSLLRRAVLRAVCLQRTASSPWQGLHARRTRRCSHNDDSVFSALLLVLCESPYQLLPYYTYQTCEGTLK